MEWRTKEVTVKQEVIVEDADIKEEIFPYKDGQIIAEDLGEDTKRLSVKIEDDTKINIKIELEIDPLLEKEDSNFGDNIRNSASFHVKCEPTEDAPTAEADLDDNKLFNFGDNIQNSSSFHVKCEPTEDAPTAKADLNDVKLFSTQDYHKSGESAVSEWNRATPDLPRAPDGDIKTNNDRSCIQDKGTEKMLQIHIEEGSNEVNKTAATFSVLKQQTITKKGALSRNKKKVTEIITKTDVPIKNFGSNFICDKCQQSFVTKQKLQLHISIHNILLESSLTCQTCNYNCPTIQALEKHSRLHDEKRPFKCNSCMYRFSLKQHLKKHVQTHAANNQSKCHTSNFNSIQSHVLNRHKKTHTTGANRLHCDVCDYMTGRSDALRRHIMTHTGEKPFQCVVCTFTCSQSNNLKLHMRTHTGDKPFQCDTCNYTCNHSSRLKEHKRTHTGDKPFQCDICNYTTSYNATFKRHKRTHTGDKPFRCDTCNYSCNQSSHLKVHKRKHAGY